MINARDYAIGLLDRAALPGWQAQAAAQRLTPPTDPRDLALAEQIRVGVIKNLGLLNHLVDHYASRPGQVDPIARKVIVLGLYQLRFLTRIPASAAVDEAVEQVRRLRRPHAAGFVNALLRRAIREPDVPLPDRARDPQQFAAVALSHPVELFQKLSALLGIDDALRFCEHSNAEPPTLVRAFSGAAFPPSEGSDGLRITSHSKPGIFVVEGAKRPTFADWAARGIAQVQDATAAGVIDHLGLQNAQDVLDRCAGMGTKTFQIHDRLADSGWVMAVDPSEQRCDAMKKLIKTRHIENIAVLQAPMLKPIAELKRPAFDRILVDVPCSNSGVLARRPEARYAQSTKNLNSLADLQDQIMDDTADFLRPGGLMVYSTCSIWPEENDRRIARFLAARGDFEPLETLATLPSFDFDPANYHDGGYIAILRRR